MVAMSDKPTVVEALSAAMAEVQAVGKGDRNNEQGYNFRGIDAVVNAVGPVFRKHGIVPVPVKTTASYRDVLTSREKRSRECTVTVTYRFYGPAGDFIDAEVPGESMDFGDKGAPKAMSVAYRILLLQTLCIPTHEPEPDSQTYERAAAQEETGSPAAIELFAAIVDAKTKTQLRAAWEGVRDARAEGRINEREAVQLNNHVKRRQGEVTDDSTDDTERGGDSARADGTGPGDDGGPAAGGGPGRDGEEGGVRPGVQPGVHRGGGGDGAAQASRGGRGAPATAGR